MIIAELEEDAANDRLTPPHPGWACLVGKIRQKDPDALEELYNVFSRGIRFYLCRQLGPQDLDDRVHDTFLVVAQAIQRGELREPARLMGYVRTIVRRQVAAQIEENVLRRRQQYDLDWGVAVHDAASNPNRPSSANRINRSRQTCQAALLKIALVVILGAPEGSGGNDFGDNALGREAAFGRKSVDCGAGLRLLLRRVVEDDRAILRAPVRALPVERGGVATAPTAYKRNGT